MDPAQSHRGAAHLPEMQKPLLEPSATPREFESVHCADHVPSCAANFYRGVDSGPRPCLYVSWQSWVGGSVFDSRFPSANLMPLSTQFFVLGKNLPEK